MQHMSSQMLRLTLLSTLVLLAGCANKNIYYWGQYEALLLDMYQTPNSAQPPRQIEQINQDIATAQEKNKRVPPGVYAHLGYMHALNGDDNQAMSAFEQEKALFPESAHFIDGMITRMSKQGGQ